MMKQIMLTLIATLISASAALACSANLTTSKTSMFANTTPQQQTRDVGNQDTSNASNTN